jgi:hypothetical protein
VYVLSMVVAFPFGALVEGMLGGGNAARLGGAAAAWGLVAPGVAAWLGQLLAPSPRINARALSLVIVGAAAAAGAVEWGVVAWAEHRFGRFDTEFIGLSNVLAPAVVGVGVSAAGWLSTQAPVRYAALGLGALFATVFATIALSNLRGLSDGLSESAWALGLGLAVPIAYVLLLLLVSLTEGIRLRRLG